MLKRMSFFLGMSALLYFSGRTQTLTVEIAAVSAVTGTSVVVPVGVDNFSEIASFQFSLAWDTTKLELLAVAGWAVDGVVAGVSEGQASFSWLSPDSQGATLPDSSSLAVLRFRVRGCPGDSAQVMFDPTGIPIEFTQLNGGQLQFITADTLSSRLSFTSPSLLSAADTVICLPGNLRLEAGCPDCSGFLWNDGNVSPVNTFDEEGLYFVTAESPEGCTFSDSIRITADTFLLDQLPDTAICPGSRLAIGINEGYQRYEWQSGDTAPSIEISTPGVYAVTVTNANNCMAADTAVITEKGVPGALILSGDHILCPEDTALLYADTVNTESFLWLDAGGSLLGEDIDVLAVSPDSSTFYFLIARNECGADTAKSEMEVERFEASAGPDTCIAAGSRLQLNASGGVAYRWLESEFPVDAPDVPNPFTQPKDSTFYSVAITSHNGCVATDTVFVAVVGNPLVFIRPINLITPNGDGKNDALYFPNLSKFGRNRISVWNRWGMLVFHKENYQADGGQLWEGTYNGSPLPEGDYFYALEVDGQVIRQNLVIIRE